MGRLIDANKLIDYFYYGQDDKPIIDGIADRKIIEIIKAQPTAYDIEKVVAEFEHEANLQGYLRQNASARCNVAQAHIHRYAEQCYRNKAIEIVKRGGAT